MIFGEKNDKMKLYIGEAGIEESDEDILICRKPSFKNHVQSLCKIASH